MSTYNLGMPHNPHVEKLRELGTISAEQGTYYATMALAFEQRTANMLALAALPGVNAESLTKLAKDRMGLTDV